MEDKIRHLPGGPPSTSSSTSVVAAAGAPGSTSQGARHRHLHQLRWWPLSELPAAPCGGPAIDVLINFGGGCCWSSRQYPLRGPPSTSCSTSVVDAAGAPGSTLQGARHQRPHQLRWWPLPELPAAPPRGATIDVLLNFGGGHCQSSR
jgi:hypothetical protein